MTVTARGPGRVNLIGEHTDYNDGLALPFAIERGVTVTATPIGGDRIEAHATDLGEEDEFDIRDVPRATGWRAFVRGTVAELRAAGQEIHGTRLEIAGDLPHGSGLSSSAALEAALCGEEGHALRIDFRTLELRPVRLDLRGWQLVTLDSGAAHEHADGGYNERRAECRAACERLGVDSLRDATTGDGLPDPLDRRVRHVLTENERVDRTVDALTAGDLGEVARLLDASHASLRDDYDASVPEVERTVERLRRAGAAGARMVGGGFGGSVLALFPPGGRRPPGEALAVVPGPAARRL